MPQGNLPTGGGGGFGDKLKGLPWGHIIPAIGSVAGAVIGAKAQSEANKANAAQAERQMAFQAEQSSTQYQRAVEDLKKAGLNPALAYKQGGNAAESGASANMQPIDFMGGAIEAYNQLSTGTAQRQLMREQAALTKAQERKTYHEGTVAALEGGVAADNDYREAYYGARRAGAKGLRYTNERMAEKFNADLDYTRSQAGTAAKSQRLMETQAILNEQQMTNVYFRKKILPYINSTAKAVEAFKRVPTRGGW